MTDLLKTDYGTTNKKKILFPIPAQAIPDSKNCDLWVLIFSV